LKENKTENIEFKGNEKNDREIESISKTTPNQYNGLYEYSERELLANEITIEKEIGKGNFGIVYVGTFKNMKVALKSLVDAKAEKEFFKEIEILEKLDHKNIVKFYGISKFKETLYLILEYVNGGDLLTYVEKLAQKKKLISEIIKKQIILEICEGMEYMHSKSVLHRDLACRNILVNIGEDEKIVPKISDFGMSRTGEYNDYYKLDTTRQIPVRWTAPEIFKKNKFYSYSDVWSFGIVIFEIFSDGERPYGRLDSNQEVLDYVLSKKIIEKSEKCPDEIYEKVMKPCFTFEYQKRPTFSNLIQILKKPKLICIF